ncbi:hypothetical protein DFH27DRAFT_303075 [Peziza echinospora]|nr:hypothetical protein DFH27DRAFT_303075 [Peziza echinospora]
MSLSPDDIRRQQQHQQYLAHQQFLIQQQQIQYQQQRQQSPNPASAPNIFASSAHFFSLSDAQPRISTPLHPPIPSTTTPQSHNSTAGGGFGSSPFSNYNPNHADFRSGGTTPSFGPEPFDEIDIDINDWHNREVGEFTGLGEAGPSSPRTTSNQSLLNIDPSTAGSGYEDDTTSPHQQAHHHTWPVTLGSKSPPPPPPPPPPQGTKRHHHESPDNQDEDGDENMIGLTQGINTNLRRAETDSSLLSTTSSLWKLSSPIVKVEDVSAGGDGEVRVAYAPSYSSRDDNTEVPGGGNTNGGSLTTSWGGRGGRMRSKSDAARGGLGIPGMQGGIQRDDDGNWVSGGGISPELRNAASAAGIGSGGGYLPMNLREEELWKKTLEKNHDIEEWLQRSRGNGGKKASGGGDNNSNNSLSVPKTRERRAKSISDFRGSEGVKKLLGLPFFGGSGDSGGGSSSGGLRRSFSRGSKKSRNPSRSRSRARGEGPMESESSTDEDSFVDSNFEEGSLDNWAPPPDDLGETEPDMQLVISNGGDDNEEGVYNPENDPDYLPHMRQFVSKPDAKPHRQYLLAREPPGEQSANAAIRRFREYVDNMETASRVATHGSSREPATAIMTAKEAERYMETEGYRLLKRLSFKPSGSGGGDSVTPRRPSIFEFPFKGLGLKRTPSSASADHRERDRPRSPPLEAAGDAGGDQLGEGMAMGSMKWKAPFAKQKGKLSIDTAFGAMVGQLAAIGAGEGSAISPGGGQLSPPGGQSGLKRARSQSGITKLVKPRPTGGLSRSPSAASAISRQGPVNLQSLMKKHGGPPALPITSPTVGHGEPANTHIVRRHTDGSQISPLAVTGAYDSDDEETIAPPSAAAGSSQQQPIIAAVRLPIITPTLEGYADNVRAHAPGLDEILVRRISTEQQKRYKKLLDHRSKHISLVRAGKCPSKARCAAALPLPLPASSVAQPAPNSAGAAADPAAVTPLQFPPNIPPPPVPRLPATFECPICFKLKTINKPSDWTKHVHEDVQPFTCTFADCNEPKSFKRKADWVRHENERHRHLEWWRCNQPECTHICYRKDNFVQHLVREHKMPEPKAKTGPAAGGRKKKDDDHHGISAEHERVWAIVDRCRNETKVLPETEKCRFCDQTCPTWKKLTVHLARHMERISLPILELVGGPGERPMDAGAGVVSVFVVPAEDEDGEGEDDDDDINAGAREDSSSQEKQTSSPPPQPQYNHPPPPQIHLQQMHYHQQQQQQHQQHQQQLQQFQFQQQQQYYSANTSPQLGTAAYHQNPHVSPQQQFYPSPQTPTAQSLPPPLSIQQQQQQHITQFQNLQLMDPMRYGGRYGVGDGGGLGIGMQLHTPSPNAAGMEGVGFEQQAGLDMGLNVGVGGVDPAADMPGELEDLGMGWVPWDVVALDGVNNGL